MLNEYTFKTIQYNDGYFAYAIDIFGQNYDSSEINYLFDQKRKVYYLYNEKKIELKSYQSIQYQYQLENLVKDYKIRV